MAASDPTGGAAAKEPAGLGARASTAKALVVGMEEKSFTEMNLRDGAAAVFVLLLFC